MKKKFLLIIFIILLTMFLFIELFIYRVIDLPFEFQILEHYENRSDILSFINIIVSGTLSLFIYLLSKKIDDQSNSENKRKRYEAICTIYDYLNETILYVKKKVFKEREDYRELTYNKDFIKCVYSLNDDLFNEDDIELLREIDLSLKHFLNEKEKGKDLHILSIKWVYKSLFDLNIPVDEIEKMNNVVDDDMLLNTQLIMILCKLRKELKYDFCKEIKYSNMCLSISMKKNIIIDKDYGNGSYISNGKGYLRIYEPVFKNKSNKLSFANGGLLYEGDIYKYKMHGSGTYYYYYGEIVSNDLIEKNAKKITKILLDREIDTTSDYVIIGSFINGTISTGEIYWTKEEIERTVAIIK